MAASQPRKKSRKHSTSVRHEAPITPLFVPKGTRTIVLFGGSFDPMTLRHWMATHALRNLAMPDMLFLYVPASKSPFKPNGPVASDKHRIAMMRIEGRLTMNGEETRRSRGEAIWTDEVDRARWERARGIERPSYTIDTVRRLRRMVPRGITLRLLIGSDQAIEFHRWKEHRKLLELAEPLVMLRPPLRSVKLLVEAFRRLGCSVPEQLAWATRVLPSDVDDDSSSSVRDELPKMPLQLEKWPVSLLTYRINDSVKQYILKHRLYGVGTKYMPTSTRRGSGGQARSSA